jgi:hypothetical protein
MGGSSALDAPLVQARRRLHGVARELALDGRILIVVDRWFGGLERQASRQLEKGSRNRKHKEFEWSI